MDEYVVIEIDDLLNTGLNALVMESKEEGFRFVERLINDYKTGTNKFNNFGEALYGVFNKTGSLVAVGGINIDPFSKEPYIGRLRRFYVSKLYRRNGLGSLLVKKIIVEAKTYFNVLVLYTDTDEASKFYTAIGFSKGNIYQNSTHYLDLKCY
ncbi:GNAT family N-acetyltransferase [Bacillus sp. SM2101]|uniref:GNAT family N-acetyltransferase n=1 Tax=Bacillus sp. SM2101 TaxID=2805366 RepID=UPI001BDDD58F|nr:GNAT family N-acetyltransferase [Bacillus sp. SM2101]